jgi:alkylated DNA nucleotide flippase Atl1
VNDLVTAIPEGRWATYGDVATVSETHPVPLGQYLARTELAGAWRVLQRSGTVSPGFAWAPDSPYAGEPPRSVLEREGVRFDAGGAADETQRLSVQELGDLIGLTVRSDVDPIDDSTEHREAFTAELSSRHSPLAVQGILELMNAWQRLGGTFTYGSGPEASCTLQAGTGPRRPRGMWPLIVYPYGTVEVDFQHMSSRAPFDEPELRDALRLRLNRVRGIDIEGDRLFKRPSFSVEVLADPDARSSVAESLEWFVSELNRYDAETVDAA